MPEQHTDIDWLRRAIELSKHCPKSTGSFAVGAVIVARDGNLIGDGFSLELGRGWHAEEVAIHKAIQSERDLNGCAIYSSLEPCSVRLSGKKPCVDHIIACGCKRVVFALHEPPVFVDCKGDETLRELGIDVVRISELAPLVEDVNRHVIAATR